MSVWALIVAGGRSERFGGELPKQFVEIAGRPCLSWTLSRFQECFAVTDIVIVAPEDYIQLVSEQIVDRYGHDKVRKVICSGGTRQQSVLNGLKALPDETKVVVIHDAARPLIATADIGRVIDCARKHDAAIVAAQATDTVKRVSGGIIDDTLNRSDLFLAQTPQAFRYSLIMRAHCEAPDSDAATDDAYLVERLGLAVHVIEPSGNNLKVTTLEDIALVEAVLRREQERE